MTNQTKLLIRGARVLTMDDADSELVADILVDGGKIAMIGPALSAHPMAAGATVHPAEGMLAMPGLVNGHLHSPGNHMKGVLDDLPLEIFMLYEVPPLNDKPPSPRLSYLRTMLGAMEMLKLGVTSVFDDAFHNPVPTMETVDAIMQAYVDIGMRAVVTIDQPNLVDYEKYPFLKEILPPEQRKAMEDSPRMSGDELVAMYKSYIAKWKGKLASPGVSCSAPQRVDPAYFAALAGLAREHGIPYAIHILETKLQRVLGKEKFGKSLVQYTRDMGVLDRHVEVIHSIWVDDADIQAMADAGCTVSHQPLCNLKIGSGVMPFRRIRDAGINVCLGSDEATTDDTANLWTVAKVAGIVHKITDPEYRRWPTAPEILRCMTRGGARAMQQEKRIGMLAPGYDADFILIDLDTLNFTPLNDLRRQLVFCENGSSVAAVFVSGRKVCENGRLLTVDEQALKAEIREAMREYQEVIAPQSARNAAVLEPYYREMYLRASKTDVGMNRWVPC